MAVVKARIFSGDTTEPFSQQGRYGVVLASSRGCSGNGLSYAQEYGTQPLKEKGEGVSPFDIAQGVILSNVEGWQDPKKSTRPALPF
jgi:hypothetical protein